MSKVTAISSNYTNTTFFIRCSELLAPDSIMYASNFAWHRVPNLDEFFYTTIPNALIQTLLSPLTNKFEGNHPTELIAFRDVIKLSGLLLATNAEVEIGSTGITYDVGNLIGSSRKAGYKAVGILTATLFGLPPHVMSAIAIGLNFGCEPFARYEKILSRGYQTCTKAKRCHNVTRSAFKQLHHSDTLNRAIIESGAKTFTSDILVGYSLKPIFKYTATKIDYFANGILSYACSSLTGGIPDFGNARGPYEKAAICIKAGGVVNLLARQGINVLYFSVEGPAKVISEFSKSSLFVPIVSSVSDGPAADWLSGSSIKSGTTISGAVATKICLDANFPAYACLPLGFITKVGLSEVYNAGYNPAVEGMDHLFGSGIRLSTTMAGVLAIKGCINMQQPAKSVCIATIPVLVLSLNAYDVTESPSITFLGDQIKSTFEVATNLVHDLVEMPIVNALYALAGTAQQAMNATYDFFGLSDAGENVHYEQDSFKSGDMHQTVD